MVLVVLLFIVALGLCCLFSFWSGIFDFAGCLVVWALATGVGVLVVCCGVLDLVVLVTACLFVICYGYGCCLVA